MDARTAIRPLRRVLLPAACWFGDLITQQICSHHQQRLRRIGWSRALEPPAGGWAAGEPAEPPRRTGRANRRTRLGLGRCTAAALPALTRGCTEDAEAADQVHE